jgi:hypothetical protein
MTHWLPQAFRRRSVREVLADQLYEAERMQVEHQAATEMHAALAAVYRMRLTRIRAEIAQTAELHALQGGAR